ncbi:MAG: hypothetical protein FP814_15950 [Desulfobacterium sp.]|nr:hypothetical protein [Desulfobacterium sp.]
MINDSETLRKFELNFISGDGRIDYKQSLKLFTAMWEEGLMLGVFPPANPMSGIETDIRISRILNTCLTKSLPD